MDEQNKPLVSKVRSALTLPPESRHGSMADQAGFHAEMGVNASVMSIIIADAEQSAHFQSRKERGLENVCADPTCKAEISPARRKALPQAIYCKDCAEMMERRRQKK